MADEGPILMRKGTPGTTKALEKDVENVSGTADLLAEQMRKHPPASAEAAEKMSAGIEAARRLENWAKARLAESRAAEKSAQTPNDDRDASKTG